MTDPKRALQAQELESLRAIFGDDWRDLPPKKTAWGTEVDEGWWELKLRARDDEQVGVVVKGKLGKRLLKPQMYPQHVPRLVLAEPKNLSPEHVKVLTKALQDQAKTLLGEEMIFTLADFVQDWMTDNHLSIPKPNETVPTLMEEMAQREEAQRAIERAQSEAEEEQRIALAAEQDRMLNEKIQLDASRKSERARQLQAEEEDKRRQVSLASLADGELDSRILELDEPIGVADFEGSWRSWTLFGGKREMLWTTFSAEPTSSITETRFVKTSLPTLAVQVIDFASSYYSTPHGRKRIDAVANEVIRLRELRSDNVLRIYAVKRDKGPKGWERLIVMVEKIAEGGRLRTWLPRVGFGEDTARGYLGEVLAGLADVHRKGGTQKQIDLDLTILTTSTSRDMTAKLAGTGYARRIGDLHRSNPFLRAYEDGTPEPWRSPDEVESPQTYTPRRDIWHAGLLLVQMLFGPQSLFVYQNLPVLLQHSPGLSGSTVELLNGLLHPNAKKRLLADEALQKLRSGDDVTHKIVRPNSVSFGVPPSPNDLLGTSPNFGKASGSYFPANPQVQAPRVSRYRSDFEEVEFLGKGGFGEVVKARNRLDGRSYAIKKVKLRPEDNENKVYREVNSLSRVSHPHIVRYYGCWLEDIHPAVSENMEDASTPSGTLTSASNEEESDIFKPNFDDLSFSRRDQSRSASFPRIRFSEATDEEELSSDESDSNENDAESDAETIPDPSEHRGRDTRAVAVARPAPKPSMSLTDASTDDSDVRTILYIQMEFVEKQTLREAIGPQLDEEQCWKLLKQVLAAMAHLAANKIVHRDTDGNVKIADFGLSTTEISALDPAGLAYSQQADIDRTSNIGTGLYIAPEVSVSRSYDEKADMYSLGVIFFEMCFLFKTQMERVQILSSLRQPSISFPPAWSPEFKPAQRQIIECLLRHDPALRPTAAELLSDPMLPSPEKTLTNPNSDQYPSLIDSLFNRSSRTYSTSTDNRHDDYTYDNEPDDELPIWLTVVVQRLVQLFQQHGAVETNLPLLIPETALLSAFSASASSKPARLLDPTGKLTRLPDSDLLAMARSATRRQIERIKRYHVGRKYAEHPAGGQPSSTGELSFDIISPLRSAVAEAEVLEVTDKFLTEFRSARGSASLDYDFHVSHETVLSTTLGLVPERLRGEVLKFFKEMGSGLGPSESRGKLGAIKGLPKHLLDDLEGCCLLDEFDVVRTKLEGTFAGSVGKAKLLAAMDEMAEIIKLARACGVNRRILFRPTLSRNAEFFRSGFMFECVRRGKQRDVIASGGRYDSLLEHFREPAQQMPSRKVFGVGMSIAVDQLARTVKKYESTLSARLMEKDNEAERSFGFWTPARCDVYILAVTGVDIAVRLSVTGELWRAGIRADLQYDDDRTMNEVERECLDQNTLFLVIPRANRTSVKVRAVLRKTEEEVPRQDLCTYLRMAIAEQRRIDATYASAEVSVPSIQAAAFSALSIEPRSTELDIRLVLPPEPQSAKGTKGRPVRKHRHATKSVYYDKAAEFLNTAKSSLPLVGVDLPLPLLSTLALDASWVHEDSEAWRGVLLGLSTADRRYAEMVREGVRDVVKEGKERREGDGGGGAGAGIACIWLFGVREGRGFLLQLGK